MHSEHRLSEATSTVLLSASVGLFLLGSVIDVYTTTTIITTPGFRELNPLVSRVYCLGGTAAFAALKLAIGGVVYAVFRRPETNWYLIVAFSTLGGLWFTAGVWNAYIFLAQT